MCLVFILNINLYNSNLCIVNLFECLYLKENINWTYDIMVSSLYSFSSCSKFADDVGARRDASGIIFQLMWDSMFYQEFFDDIASRMAVPAFHCLNNGFEFHVSYLDSCSISNFP